MLDLISLLPQISIAFKTNFLRNAQNA